MTGNRTVDPKVATLAMTLLLLTVGGPTLHAATLTVSASPASGWISSDGKVRVTESLQGEFQDATTIKQFKVTIKNSAGTPLYSLPASTDTGAVCNTTTAVCIYYTNGTTYAASKALTPGTYKIEGTVRVYGKKQDGSIDEGNFKGTTTSTIDYVVPKPFGWLTPITRQNAPGISVSTKLSGAEDTVEGHTIKQILSDSGVKVRADNKACQECHSWAPTISKTDFCNTKVTSFNNSQSKPQVLKSVFNNWKSRSCVD